MLGIVANIHSPIFNRSTYFWKSIEEVIQARKDFVEFDVNRITVVDDGSDGCMCEVHRVVAVPGTFDRALLDLFGGCCPSLVESDIMLLVEIFFFFFFFFFF